MSVYSRFLIRLLLLTFINLTIGLKSIAQLCTGSLGDPVVNITFGAGTNPGPALNSATNYTYVSTDCPNDGMYTVINKTLGCFGPTWHSIYQDHTGDQNGYFMLVNASFEPSDFYIQKVDGLCGNTTYEFAAWILNMCLTEDRIKPNLTFKIEKTDGTLLQSFNSGDIGITPGADWKQYGFYFKTPLNTSSVVIRITNNAPGGIGNDLALDDITFRPCGAKITASVNGFNSNTVDLCDGNTSQLTLNANVSAGYNAPAYQWQSSSDNGVSWKDIAGANSVDYSFTPTAKGSTLYRLAVAETGNLGITGCRVASNNITITIHFNPVVKLSMEKVICEGETATLNASILLNSGLPWDTLWTYPDINQSFLSNVISIDSSLAVKATITKKFKASLNSAGKYSFHFVNRYGCEADADTSLIVYRKPVASFVSPNPLCENKAILFSDQSSGTASIKSWFWKFGDGDSSNQKNPTHVFLKDGLFPVQLIVADTNNCKSDINENDLTVHPLPVINFKLPKICLSDPYASFIDSSTISDQSENQFMYSWNFGDPSSGTNNISALKSPIHKYHATGNYTIQLNITSNSGCINDTSKIFTVNGVVPRASFDISNQGNICSKDLLNITNSSTVDFGNIVKVEIYWDYTNNFSLSTIDNDPAPGKTYSNDYSKIINQHSQDYTIKYVAYSGINCVDETTKTITIYKNPQVNFTALPATCFETTPFLITNATETSGDVGTGIFSGDGVNSEGLFTPAAAGTGLHSIDYTFTDIKGCQDSKQQIINIYPQPSVNSGEDKILIKGTYLTLHATAKGNNLSYLWTPALNIAGDSSLNPRIFPNTDITYTLTVTSIDGCTNHDDVDIKVLNALYVPNAFTPNGDGINDVWRLPSLESYPNAEAWIFNRWGQIVFHSKGPYISWDGTFNGKPEATGTYIYLIDLKNGSANLKGTVTLIR